MKHANQALLLADVLYCFTWQKKMSCIVLHGLLVFARLEHHMVFRATNDQLFVCLDCKISMDYRKKSRKWCKFLLRMTIVQNVINNNDFCQQPTYIVLTRGLNLEPFCGLWLVIIMDYNSHYLFMWVAVVHIYLNITQLKSVFLDRFHRKCHRYSLWK